MIVFDKTRPLVYQSDAEFGLMPVIKKSACYAMVIMEILTDLFHLPFTHESVMAYIAHEVLDLDKDITSEMLVEDPQNFCDDLVGPDRVCFMGWKSPMYVCKPNEAEAGRWWKESNTFKHFVHMYRDQVFYDPWSKDGSDSVKHGVLLDKRVFAIL